MLYWHWLTHESGKKSSNLDMTDAKTSARIALLNARQAMQRGDRPAARAWARQAVTLAPEIEDPWLFLAALASPQASVAYVERALKINPDSQAARRGMDWAVERLNRLPAPQSSTEQTQPHRIRVNTSSVSSASVPDSKKPRLNLQNRWSRSLKRFSSRWQNWVGFLLVTFFVVVAAAAPLISPNTPKSSGAFVALRTSRLGDKDPHPPAMMPPLGTLPGQFDGFHALVWGARDAIIFGLEVVILAAMVGFLIGAIAGYAGGFFSSVLMRLTDSFLAFPVIAGVVFLNQLWVSVNVAAGGFFDSYHNTWIQNVGGTPVAIQSLLQAINPLILILVLFSWMPYARITHSIVASLKKMEFIQAAHSIGVRAPRIILRHLLPNSISPSIVLAARDMGSMVILQATFTFIGLDGSSTWGKILVLGKDWVLGPGGGFLAYWWVYVPATLALVLFGIGWNLFGDGLSELLDPRDT